MTVPAFEFEIGERITWEQNKMIARCGWVRDGSEHIARAQAAHPVTLRPVKYLKIPYNEGAHLVFLRHPLDIWCEYAFEARVLTSDEYDHWRNEKIADEVQQSGAACRGPHGTANEA